MGPSSTRKVLRMAVTREEEVASIDSIRVALKRALSAASFFVIWMPLLAAGAGENTFTGVITDDMCPKGDHSKMQMGANDAECTRACVSIHGAEYVLCDGKHTFALSDQKSPEVFAGQRVKVTGTLDAKTNTIVVKSIAAAK